VRNTLPVPRTLALACSLALLLLGCGKEIGDSCQTNIDCDQNSTRDCDLSQPGGYCTVYGCDEKSCPGGSVCVRFFSYLFSTTTCQSDADCAAEALCLPDSPAPLCVPRLSEQYCVKTCGSNGDCRGGYQCQTAGQIGLPADGPTRGSLALVNTDAPSKPIRFCAPQYP
jgi:hypothetical protein